MSSHFTRISVLTGHLLQNRSYSVLRSITKISRAEKMESRIPKDTSIAISDLYRDREQYDERDRLRPVKDPLFAPDQDVNKKILIHIGDITALKVDAIVNAANRSLLGGGGVDGRIHDVAGPQLLEECRSLNGCRTGSAKITDAYKLPCQKVIHAVGPIYNSSKKEESAELLASCYKTSLTIAAASNLKTIAFSCLSTGVYGYPSKKAASVALDTVRTFLWGLDGHEIDQVIFCLFLRKDVDVYLDYIPYYFPPLAEELPAITETRRPGHMATELVSDETKVTATLDPNDKNTVTTNTSATDTNASNDKVAEIKATDTSATDTKAPDDKITEIKATDTGNIETSSEGMITKATSTELESTVTTNTEPTIIKATVTGPAKVTATGADAGNNGKLDKEDAEKQEQKNIPDSMEECSESAIKTGTKCTKNEADDHDACS